MAKTVKILVLINPVEAHIMGEILNERNIPHLIKSSHDLVYDGLWQTPTAWGQLDAPEEYREEIMKIYEQLSLSEDISDTTE